MNFLIAQSYEEPFLFSKTFVFRAMFNFCRLQSVLRDSRILNGLEMDLLYIAGISYHDSTKPQKAKSLQRLQVQVYSSIYLFLPLGRLAGSSGDGVF